MHFLTVLSAVFLTVQSSPEGRKPQPRIIGGSEAEPHSAPYQLYLILIDKTQQYRTCGGSLIVPNWALTAAHCFQQPNALFVILGVHNITAVATEGTVLNVPLQNVIVHENFDGVLFRNDIALIKLPINVTLTEKIQTIHLPTRSEIASSEMFVGETATLAGWGQTSDKGLVSDVLRIVESSIISTQECNVYFLRLAQKYHICINGRGRLGACFGDSGGPLVVQRKDRLEQVGIASFVNLYSCEYGWPTVFTRVSSYVAWIESKTGLTFE